jgi:hypothetical protein
LKLLALLVTTMTNQIDQIGSFRAVYRIGPEPNTPTMASIKPLAHHLVFDLDFAQVQVRSN